jgi:ligand-binding sensor domain-containing protein
MNARSLSPLILLLAFLFVCSSCRKGSEGHSDPVPPPPPGEQPVWTFYNTTNSKLPDNQVNAIAISKDNVQWIGTANGLVRIKDQQWTIYNAEQSALPSSTINALSVEPGGDLWIGTSKGLAKLTSRGITAYTKANSILPANAIMSITHDNNSGVTWVGTERGLVKIKGQEWTLYNETAGHLLLSMAVDPQGVLWLATFDHFGFQGKIKTLDQGRWKSYNLDQFGYPSTHPYKIEIDRNGHVVALLTGTSVSAMIRIAGGVLQELPKPSEATGIRSFIMEQEKIWIGGRHLTLLGAPAQQVMDIPGITQGVLSMALGTDGKKWMGTTGAGLAIYNR